MGHDIYVGKTITPILPENKEDYDLTQERIYYCIPTDCFEVSEDVYIRFGAGNQLADEFYAMFHLACCHDGCGGNGDIVYIPKNDFEKWLDQSNWKKRLKMIGDDGRIKKFIINVSKLYETQNYLFWTFR